MQQIEQRLALLEKVVKEIQDRLAAPNPQGNWLEKVIGCSMENFPEFEQVLEYGREFRRADTAGTENGSES